MRRHGESAAFDNREKQRQFLNAIHADLLEAERLVRSDPNFVRYRDGVGETAFHHLIIESQLTRAEKLLAWGSDINTQTEFGATPLINAVMLSNLETVKWLVTKGASLDLKTVNDDTALSLATSNENAAIFQYLINLPRQHPIDFYYDDLTADMILRDEDLVMRGYLVSLGLSQRYGDVDDG